MGGIVLLEYMRGEVTDIILDKIILEVNGIGYRINSTLNSTMNIKKGDRLTILTHLALKEDEINLYGFTTREELILFKQLISISKIGPKVATAILSTYTPQKLCACIINNDVSAISKAPGVGKKTAERIVLELKDKVDKIIVDYGDVHIEEGILGDNEVIDALMSLGYSRQEGEQALKAINNTNLPTEEKIKEALKWLVK